MKNLYEDEEVATRLRYKAEAENTQQEEGHSTNRGRMSHTPPPSVASPCRKHQEAEVESLSESFQNMKVSYSCQNYRRQRLAGETLLLQFLMGTPR